MWFVVGEETLFGVGETKLEAVQHAMNRVKLNLGEFQSLMKDGAVILPRRNLVLYMTQESM